MSLQEIKVPDIGDFKDVEVIELLVKPGDTITAEQSLITVESDKASMEIPASHAGVVKEVKIGIGDKVSQGSLLLMLETDGAATTETGTSPAASAAPTPSPAPPPASSPAPAPVAAAPAPAPSSTKPLEVAVPDIGDFKEVEVIELLVKPGDTIAAEQSLITVESDKASMEIPSSHAGVVKELKVRIGDKVSQGTPLLLLEASAGSTNAAATAAASSGAAPRPAQASAPAPTPAPATAPAAGAVPAFTPTTAKPAPTAALEPIETNGLKPHASPSVRKFARELGVDLKQVQGSGTKGRIMHEDVQSYVKAVLTGQAAGSGAPTGKGGGLDLLPWPSLDFSKFGATELQPLSRIKKISGPNLHRNWVMIPHVTQFDEADITELEAFRKDSNAAMAKSGVKLTMLAFVIKACVAALKKLPAFNASLDTKGENLILKQYYHIGFAADTPNGLMVPVIKDVDKKGIVQIAQEMGELSAQARDGKLKPADMQGASFTISSLGGIGGTAFTPIINAPEVAILGLSRSAIKPVWDGKQFAPRLMLPLSLSYDHRVIDGAMAARFTVYLGEVLADMRRTLL